MKMNYSFIAIILLLIVLPANAVIFPGIEGTLKSDKVRAMNDFRHDLVEVREKYNLSNEKIDAMMVSYEKLVDQANTNFLNYYTYYQSLQTNDAVTIDASDCRFLSTEYPLQSADTSLETIADNGDGSVDSIKRAIGWAYALHCTWVYNDAHARCVKQCASETCGRIGDIAGCNFECLAVANAALKECLGFD